MCGDPPGKQTRGGQVRGTVLRATVWCPAEPRVTHTRPVWLQPCTWFSKPLRLRWQIPLR